MKRKGSSLGSASVEGFSVAEDIGAMTLLEKRMLEKKSGKFLLDDEIKYIFKQFDRSFGFLSLASMVLRSSIACSCFLFCRDNNGYLGAHDLAIVYRSMGIKLEDDLVCSCSISRLILCLSLCIPCLGLVVAFPLLFTFPLYALVSRSALFSIHRPLIAPRRRASSSWGDLTRIIKIND